MALVIPPELKKITTFIRRAEELDKDKSNPESRVVAYYCRQYAVQIGIPLATSGPGKKSLGELLGQLETEKQAMSVFSREESKLICRRFADRIFTKADTEDRAGAAGKGTARTFYAAASFFEILQQFYPKTEGSEKTPEEEEEAEKRVYCKWKATEILKAIREGRKPAPGGYGDNTEEVSPDEKGGEDADVGDALPATQSDEAVPPVSPPANLEAPEVFVPPPPTTSLESETGKSTADEGTECGLNGPHEGVPPEYPDNEGGDVNEPPPYRPPPKSSMPKIDIPPPPMPAPTYNPPAPTAPSASSSLSSMLGMRKKKQSKSVPSVSKAALADAAELTRFALAALEDKDSDLAAERLQQALTALGR